jgi:sugar lactone lactonase YvrE
MSSSSLTPSVVSGAPRSILGEGPSWDEESGTLYWVDIKGGRVHWWNLSSGTFRTLDLKQTVSCVVPTRVKGKVMVTLKQSFAVLDLNSGSLSKVKEIRASDRVRFNDGKCDPRGRFWAGTMDMEEREPLGSLYVLGSDMSLRGVVEKVTVSNGIGWSPDHSEMYYIDSPTRRIMVLDYDVDTGQVKDRGRRIDLSSYPGVPDGMTVDSEGKLWVALWGGNRVLRIEPSGRVIGEVKVPALHVTSCVFGGARLNTLFITTAQDDVNSPAKTEGPDGRLFMIDLEVPGAPTYPFSGRVA